MRTSLRSRCIAALACAALAACNAVLDNRPASLDDDAGASGRSEWGVGDDASAGDAAASAPSEGSADGEPDAGPRGCAAGTKACGGLCVSTDDPFYGCAARACARCAMAHATAGCAAGACAVAACERGFADCDRDPSTGCEASLDAVTSCGACGIVCPKVPHTTPSCRAGACALACEDGFGDCNAKRADGCEADLRRDDRNCGECGRSCVFSTCVDGVCRWKL